jgi:hypothetical protein
MAAWRWRNVPAPEGHVIGLVVGIVIAVFVPWRLFQGFALANVLGWPLALAGLSLAAWAILAVADTDITEPSHVVIRGPYAYSRNPMYVAWTLIYAGISFAWNSTLALGVPAHRPGVDALRGPSGGAGPGEAVRGRIPELRLAHASIRLTSRVLGRLASFLLDSRLAAGSET